MIEISVDQLSGITADQLSGISSVGAMFSRLKRIGNKAFKVQLIIDLREITIIEDRDDINLVCVELRRGNKTISSSSKLWSNSDQPPIKLDEQLTLTMTLYKDYSGKFSEKNGKMHLNGHSSVTNSSVCLGSADLKFHHMASDFAAQRFQLVLLNSSGKEMGEVTVNVKAKFLGDGFGDEEGHSLGSILSNFSAKSVVHSDILYPTVYREAAGILIFYFLFFIHFSIFFTL